MKLNRYLLALVGLAALHIAPAQADCVLKQSTASQVIQLPRFVDSTDGVTAETGLTIANTDIKLGKSGATTQASKNSGGATHIATGDYYTTLDATDTNTVGNLHIVIGVAGALPVWVDCVVLEEAVYDAVYGASATGYLQPTVATRTLDVSATGEVGLDITNIITCTGAVPALGIIDCGTAQSVSGTTLVLRSAANFDADSEIIGSTCVIGTATTGAGQSRAVTAYTNATDTATVATWTTTPTGTITYACFGTSSSSGTVSIASGGIAASSFAAGAIDASAIATDAIGAAEVAAGGATEIGDAAWASATRVLTAATNLTTALATPTNITAGTITTVTNLTNAPTAGDLTATMKTSVGTAVATAQGLLTGTCSSGSTTTCVDAARTEADATQLQDRLICFSDGWCGMLTTFNTGSDTATTTKVAPSTRASKTYTIFPSTAL